MRFIQKDTLNVLKQDIKSQPVTKVKDVLKEIDNMKDLISLFKKIPEDLKYEDLYYYIYKSKYENNLSFKTRYELDNYLKYMSRNYNSALRTSNQENYYRYVYINNIMYDITSRYYISPTPENFPKIVKELTRLFLHKADAGCFKYQLEGNAERSDRVIIYSNKENEKQIEKLLKELYDDNKELFDGCERPINMIYKSKIPNIYFAKETKDSSYGIEFAKALIEAKDIYKYLYKDSYNDDKIKIILTSTLLKKSLLITKDYKKINMNNKSRYVYNKALNTISKYFIDNNKYYKIVYLDNPESKKEFLNDFYNPTFPDNNKFKLIKEIDESEYSNEYHKQELESKVYKK